MKNVSALIIGSLFSLGLCISGMIDPTKVLGFLDLFGAWDPSLAFVMAGGLCVAMIGYALTRNRQESLLGAPMSHPANVGIDARLVAGGAIFGIGWGLAGICPGPAIVNLGFFRWPAAMFVVAMLAGMMIYNLADRGMTSRSVKSEMAHSERFELPALGIEIPYSA